MAVHEANTAIDEVCANAGMVILFCLKLLMQSIAMYALLFPSLESVKAACQAVEAGVCQVANDNSPQQIVISGTETAVKSVLDECRRTKAFKRAIKLNVSAPFHTSLLASAGEAFQHKLMALDRTGHGIWKPSRFPVYCNITAHPMAGLNDDPVDSGLVAEQLSRQLVSPVRWRESVLHAADQHNISHWLEFGPPGVVGRLVQQCLPDAIVQ